MNWQRNKMDIKRENLLWRTIDLTVICPQVNNGFHLKRKTSVRFYRWGKKKKIAPPWVLQLIYWSQRGISQGLPVCFSLIWFWAAMHERTTNKAIALMRVSIHLFVRDSKQRKQKNGGGQWGQRLTTAKQCK